MIKGTAHFQLKLEDKYDSMKGEIDFMPDHIKIKNTNGTVYRVPYWNVICVKDDKYEGNEKKQLPKHGHTSNG